MAQWLAEKPAVEGLPDGSAWNSARWRFPEASNFPVAIADVQGGALRLRPAATTARNAIARLPAATAQALRGRFRRSQTTGTNRLTFYISSSGVTQASTSSEQPTSGYALMFSNTGGYLFARRLAGVTTTLATASAVYAGTGWFNFIFERTAANVVRFKAWADGTAEPVGWTAEHTDTEPLAPGVPQITTLGAAPAEFYFSDLAVTSPGLPKKPRPVAHRDVSGALVPYGKLRRSLTDDCLSATVPSWATSTALTYDASSFQRLLTAPASGAATITLPAVNLSGSGRMQAVWLDLDCIELNNLGSVQLDVALIGGGNTYQARISSTQPKVVLSGQGLTYTSSGGMLGDLDQKPHGLSLLMLPRAKQIQVIDNGDQVLGWIDLPTTLTETVTPTITLTALSASARVLRFGQLRLRLEQGVENVSTPAA